MLDSVLFDEYMDFLNNWDSLGLWLFLRTVSDEEQTDLYGSFPKGQKVKYKHLHTALDKAGYQIASNLSVEIDGLAANEDDQGLREATEIDGILFILNMCANETISYIEDNLWTTEF